MRQVDRVVEAPGSPGIDAGKAFSLAEDVLGSEGALLRFVDAEGLTDDAADRRWGRWLSRTR